MPSNDGTIRSRSLGDRRRDQATADAVEVALLYLDVFGNGAMRQYLPLTDIPRCIVQRIVAHHGQLRQR